jgi:hypothetical protein
MRMSIQAKKTLMGFPYFLATRREYGELGQRQLDYEGD